jgi:predicted Zn-dependent protease with MMP-like domain/predicted Zn-dependent protease
MSRTDRMLADIERGFEALEAGKIDAAATIVERLRRIDRKNPDVVTLAAATADAQGDAEEAIAQYRLLVELQPDNPMPRICLARLELHDVGDADSALDMVESAFDFIDDEADLVEAIYVKTEALLARDEPVAARETLAELASSVIEDPELALDLGELALAAEDPAAALRFIEIARKADPDLEADALHAIGRVHELTGDRDKMIEAWTKVRTLDLAAPPGKVHITEDEVERIASATLAELPANIRQRLENVPIMIDTIPSEDIVADGYDPRMLGFFQGVPMPEDGGAQPTVTNILLFKTNLERSATDEAHLAEEIRITVLHETAHYFGLDEDDLEALGLD